MFWIYNTQTFSFVVRLWCHQGPHARRMERCHEGFPDTAWNNHRGCLWRCLQKVLHCLGLGLAPPLHLAGVLHEDQGWSPNAITVHCQPCQLRSNGGSQLPLGRGLREDALRPRYRSERGVLYLCFRAFRIVSDTNKKHKRHTYFIILHGFVKTMTNQVNQKTHKLICCETMFEKLHKSHKKMRKIFDQFIHFTINHPFMIQ